MPYHVFLTRPFAAPELLACFDSFVDASRRAKALRSVGGAPGPAKIRIMFAASAEEAENLLCQVRDPAPAGDE
ncbi:MAG: hypothetical protein KGI35_15785 [Burkholderiales bacterium]|nr:hypothetical protein [Burkholderiales bacterium]